MRAAPTFAPITKALLGPALWFCVSHLLLGLLAAQCPNATQVPDQTISSGTVHYVDNIALAASNVIIHGSASVTFVAGSCIELQPGFHATAGTAGTTFHAWVDTWPTADSVWPSSGSGLSQTFTWKASSPSGYTNLSEIYALFNTWPSGANACYIRYHRGYNLLYLADNQGSGWLGGFVPGSGGSASNSQCTIYGSGASVSGLGAQLTVTVPVAFQTSFSGTKSNFLLAYDNAGLNSTWQSMGQWTVTGAPPQYYLTTVVSPSGGGTISPASGWYNSGTQVWVTATPASGYTFTGFSGDLTGSTNPQLLTMNGNKSVTANCQPTPQYYLTTAVSPAGAGTVSPASGWYNSGSPVTITATPASGYQFTGFTGTVNSGANPLTVTMNSAMTETANFAPTATEYQLTTSVSPPGGGTVSPACPAGCIYSSGTPVTITATPATGYQFTGFTGTVNSGSNPLAVIMNSAMTETANFAPIATRYQLTTGVSPSGGGIVSPACPGGCMYDSGTEVTITATPATGYQFTGFSGDLTGSTNPQPLTMNGNKSVTANYQAVSIPDFSLLSRTGSQILAAGRSGQYTVSVQPINGFSGTVYFSASGLPSGAAAIFNPPSITGSGSTTMTVSTTSASVTNNPISITITGTSGSLDRSVMPYLTVNPPGYSIYPAGVEVNLSVVPLDRYLLFNDDGSGTPIISHCPVAYTVRQCIAKLFNNDPGNPIAQGPNGVPVEWNNWRAQGVTGVRFFFGVAGGFWSTPYIPNSPDPPYSESHPTISSGRQPEAAWTNNLDAFFQDLRTYGILRVTPTPVLEGWGWPHGMIRVTVPPVCGDPQTTELNFLPFLPFGHKPENNYPDQTCGDQSYQNGQSPATPDYIFWGWDRFFNLVDAVVSKAASNQLAVNTLDYYQETNMAAFTVQARMIYDSTRNVDVIASLQDIMGWYHDNVFGGIDPLGASPSANQPEVPTPVTDNCVSSYYGDSGQLLALSALVAALKGNKAIGQPGYNFPIGLPCGSLLSGGTDVPVGRRLFPSFIDIHTQKNFNLLTDMAGWSKNFHDRMYEFLFPNGLSGRRVVFGETNPVDPPGCNSPWTKEQAETMLYGIPGSENGFANSLLFLSYAGNVVMRPWQDITHVHSACMAFPNTINPPFNPMQ